MTHQCKTRIHHAEPFVVTRKILTKFTYNFTQPFKQPRIAYIIIINPPFFTSVIRWVDVYAIYTTFILRKKRLKCSKIIPMDNHILAIHRFFLLTLYVKTIFMFQRSKGNFMMMFLNFIFSNPI